MRDTDNMLSFLFIESFLQICFEGKSLQNRLRADKKELRSLAAVGIQVNQRGDFCIVPICLVMNTLDSMKVSIRNTSKIGANQS